MDNKQTKLRNKFFKFLPKAAQKPTPKSPDRAPSLGQMRRFVSGRDAFASFDWTTQIAPVDRADGRDYYSDDEANERREKCEFFEGEDVIIPFSAPITAGGGVSLQPRKEINIWKRRTMNPPRPLQLNPTTN